MACWVGVWFLALLSLASPASGTPEAAVANPAGPAVANPAGPAVANPAAPAVVNPAGPAVALLWNQQRAPAPGPPQAIGAYAGGCLQGAVSLPASGPGYEALHRLRSRYFGHPALIEFIQRLGGSAKARRLGVVIVGDMSQARGGPTLSGHRSHQSGLDVDIGYAAPPGVRAGHVKVADRERLAPPAVVDLRTHRMTSRWGSRVIRLLAAAASDPAVDRLFVNPAVKRALCAGPARRAPWFARVRPWWGHHDHFHVRLTCPEGNPLCAAQEPPPIEEDGGCGATLAWWFTPDAQATQARREQATQGQTGQEQGPAPGQGQGPAQEPAPPPGPVLPDACTALLTSGP